VPRHFRLAVPLYIYGASHLPKWSPWRIAVVIGGTLAWMVAIMSGKWVISALKSRVTYPRTGYVACAKPKAKGYWFPVLLAPLLLAAVFGPRQMVMPLTGLAGAMIAIAVAWQMGANRFYILGGIFFGLGAALGVIGVDVNTGMSLLYGIAGGLLMVSGGLRLRHYLEHA
jgi:hypothetical protein